MRCGVEQASIPAAQGPSAPGPPFARLQDHGDDGGRGQDQAEQLWTFDREEAPAAQVVSAITLVPIALVAQAVLWSAWS